MGPTIRDGLSKSGYANVPLPPSSPSSTTDFSQSSLQTSP